MYVVCLYVCMFEALKRVCPLPVREAQKRAQRSCFWTYNFRSISEEPRAGPPRKFFRKRRVILDDKTRGFEHLRQPRASIN